MSSKIATAVGRKFVGNNAKQYETQDPHYETYTNAKGKQKRRKRAIPQGLSAHDAAVLKKVRRRAHYLDKGMSLCGWRVGWTFFLGLIPGLGDVVDFGLGYKLVVSPCKTCELPATLEAHLMCDRLSCCADAHRFNLMLATGVGLVPIVGDIM